MLFRSVLTGSGNLGVYSQERGGLLGDLGYGVGALGFMVGTALPSGPAELGYDMLGGEVGSILLKPLVGALNTLPVLGDTLPQLSSRVGSLIGDGASSTAQWLQPAVGDLVDTAMQRSGLILNVVDNGSNPRIPTISLSSDDFSLGSTESVAPIFGTAENPRLVPFNRESVRISMPQDGGLGEVTAPVDGNHVAFGYFQDTADGPYMVLNKTARLDSGEYVKLDGAGLTEGTLNKMISSYSEVTGAAPAGLPGDLAFKNLSNFQQEYAAAREANQLGSSSDWAQTAVRNISFGSARQSVGYGSFSMDLGKFGDVGSLQNVPGSVYIVGRPGF